MANIEIDKIPKFTSLIDGVIDSIRDLRNLTITHITHFSDYSDIVLLHKHIQSRVIVSISNNPQAYSILLQIKNLSKDKVEDYSNLREIKVEGNYNLGSIEKDIKKILGSDYRFINHRYFPF